ncbi:MAG: aromatic ring-hydroxylating dioxygenase subunit alpha [Novosphingobium sp.]|nr:aromatic ring-hydroxylating dioxygenase subunit alpha [Novosphingobium sp.]
MGEASDIAALKAAPFRVDDPERIPSKRYYDPDFFELEKEKLWPHVWQMAARLEQIPNVGDWIEYTILDKSVIVVRGKEGVKAFHNVCRHRGVALAQQGGHGNCRREGFICPFHGWRWNTEGQNTFVYGKHLFDERQLDKDDIALTQCKVELWGGGVWINFDHDAPSFRDFLGPMTRNLEAHHVDKLRVEWCYGTVLPANWKLAMEAFMEGYHVMRTHPQLQQVMPHIYNSMYGSETGGIGAPNNPNATSKKNIEDNLKHFELLSAGMAGMVHAKEVEIMKGLGEVDLPEDPQEAMMTWFGMANAAITEKLRERGEPCPDLNAVAVSHPVHAVEFMFPHYFLLPTFSSMSGYRIRPLTPETCLFEIYSLTLYPEGEEPAPVMEPIMLPYDSPDFPEIPRQDYSNIPLQQKGLHGGGFEFMRLSKNIEGLISNYQRIIDGYLTGTAPQKLAAAVQQLGGNFDGPIKDLGI